MSCCNGYQYFQKSYVFKQDFFIDTIFITITQPLSSCIKHFPNFISANKYTRTPVCTQCPYTCKTRPNEMKKSENCLQGLLHSWYAKVAISEEQIRQSLNIGPSLVSSFQVPAMMSSPFALSLCLEGLLELSMPNIFSFNL